MVVIADIIGDHHPAMNLTVPNDVCLYFQNKINLSWIQDESLKIYVLYEQSYPLQLSNDVRAIIYTDPSLLAKIPKEYLWIPRFYVPSLLDLGHFIPKDRREPGLHYHGYYACLPEYHDRMELLNNLRKQGFQFDILFNAQTYEYQAYCNHLCAEEMQLVIFSENQTVSGRLYENAAAGSLNVIYVPTAYIAQRLREDGWYHLYNCFFFTNLSDLIALYRLDPLQIKRLAHQAHFQAAKHNIQELFLTINRVVEMYGQRD